MEKEKGRERVPDGGRGMLEEYFSVFTRCSRSIFLYLYGVLEGERHGAVRPCFGAPFTSTLLAP